LIEVSDIKIVSQIYKAGSIQLASSEIGLTQPALTKRLQAMEDRLGFEIFQRMPRGVKLTQLGELFVTQGADLLSHAQDIEAEINRHKVGEEGSLKIGVRPCIQSIFFRKSLIAFSSEYPGIHLKIDTRDAAVICDAIRAGQLDFAVIALGYEDEYGADPVLHPSLKFDQLFYMPVSIVVRKDHAVLNAKDPATEILKYPVACETPPASLQRSLKRVAQEAGIPFDGARILVDDYDFILRLVSRSNFWTSVFSENEKELKRRDQFAFLREDDLIPPMKVGICARKNWTMPLTAKKLVDTLIVNAAAYTI
jgi:DNA-binding transcriptional LysR family regulator